MKDFNTLLELAVKETENLEHGETFMVRDLFKGYEWNRIPRSTRLLLGTMFLNYVSNNLKEIKPVEKSSAGQQKYIKL